MQVKVKNIYQREEIFEVNLEENVSVLASLVKERFNYENNVKLIYVGKVLLHEIPMKNYFNEHLKTILICLEDKNKEINLSEDIIQRGKKSVNRMLEISYGKK
jgi:quinolinate synthase